MDAAVWTALAILAAVSLGTLLYLGARIDALAARTDARSTAWMLVSITSMLVSITSMLGSTR
ncbi:MAG TPA: hypothetical protein VKB32_04630 [Actinomycetota bacterium]|jgi:hypothetical protein|nr:hypothetical protein [Actinomycetota bacterium]